jgi:(1->4)-alpha-D-glucan 1-alpha-D-glucosylmutase
MALPVLSTYRLQLRGESSGFAFTLTDAENLLDYLDELGVSHLYLSPILTAAAGSNHGYDVTDPTTVSAELGGADGLARLSAAARTRGMGLVVDIVPNHMGIERPEQNPWWWDVLRHGSSSPYAAYFDIDWDLDDGRIVLPILGSDDDVADLRVDGDRLRLGDLTLPVAPGTAGGTGPEVHDRQHYRLVGWRNAVCGYRRFFSITSLAGLRQEHRAVFDATHAEVARWFAADLVDGVRIDHPDGLADPCEYLVRLRELVGPGAWIVIEKILAADEALEPTLPVAGTTGYDMLRAVGGLFVDPSGAPALTALVESAGVSYADYSAMSEMLSQLKIRTATHVLASELRRLRRSIAAAAGADDPQLPEAVAALLTHIGVYRCDYPGLAAIMPSALAETQAASPQLGPALQVLAAALAQGGEPAARLQQLCGAVTAKSVEDCYFYRDARLVSLNEVGGEPRRFGVGAAEFHDRAAIRARTWPLAMTTLTTHDTKRGEDVRARIGVLSQVPSLWTEFVARWEIKAPSPDPATGRFLWQNIFGVWPVDGQVTGSLRDRLHAYAEKAIREASWHTTWNDPDTEFEGAVHRWLDSVLDGPVAGQLTKLVAQLNPHAISDALGQKLLALTVPGIPDVYQGTELWDDSLVDPDNRRPVDYAARRSELDAMRHPKMRVVAAALRLRRARPDVFPAGRYVPVLAGGDAGEHVVAFCRGDDVLVAVTRWTVRLKDTGWGNTVLPLPEGSWTDTLTGAAASGPTPAAQLFADLPVALLERRHA